MRLQALLIERFKLLAHREVREQPVYALLRVRNDSPVSQLKPVSIDCETLQAARARGDAPLPPFGDRPPCGAIFTPVSIRSGGVTMTGLAQSLSQRVDRTGLAGHFEFDLIHSPHPRSQGTPVAVAGGAGSPSDPNAAVSVFTALQEQLGLRLESTRAPVEVLVIDSVERPTPD